MVHPWPRLPGFRDVDSLDNRDPALLLRVAGILRPVIRWWFSPEVRGLDRIPEGAGLYVANHSGGLITPETWILGLELLDHAGMSALPHALAHDAIIEAPGLNQLLTRLGTLEAKHGNAHRAFVAGRKVLVYPGGDIDNCRPSKDRDRIVFGPRRGYIRLVLRERVPILPVVSAGAHDGWWVISDGRRLAEALRLHRWLRVEVMPITLSIPWGLAIGWPIYVPWPHRVLMEILEPIRFERDGPEASCDDAYVEECHRQVLATMQRALDRLAGELRGGAPAPAPGVERPTPLAHP